MERGKEREKCTPREEQEEEMDWAEICEATDQAEREEALARHTARQQPLPPHMNEADIISAVPRAL